MNILHLLILLNCGKLCFMHRFLYPMILDNYGYEKYECIPSKIPADMKTHDAFVILNKPRTSSLLISLSYQKIICKDPDSDIAFSCELDQSVHDVKKQRTDVFVCEQQDKSSHNRVKRDLEKSGCVSESKSDNLPTNNDEEMGKRCANRMVLLWKGSSQVCSHCCKGWRYIFTNMTCEKCREGFTTNKDGLPLSCHFENRELSTTTERQKPIEPTSSPATEKKPQTKISNVQDFYKKDFESVVLTWELPDKYSDLKSNLRFKIVLCESDKCSKAITTNTTHAILPVNSGTVYNVSIWTFDDIGEGPKEYVAITTPGEIQTNMPLSGTVRAPSSTVHNVHTSFDKELGRAKIAWEFNSSEIEEMPYTGYEISVYGKSHSYLHKIRNISSVSFQSQRGVGYNASIQIINSVGKGPEFTHEFFVLEGPEKICTSCTCTGWIVVFAILCIMIFFLFLFIYKNRMTWGCVNNAQSQMTNDDQSDNPQNQLLN